MQFLDKVVTCPLLRRLVREGAFLVQGGDMRVVATTGAWRYRRCSSCGCGRPCDQAATSWGLANSESASDSVHREGSGGGGVAGSLTPR